MALTDLVRETLQAVLFDPETTGRSVRYTPRSGTTAKDVPAVVEYLGDAVEGGLVAAVQQQAVVHVLTTDVPSPRYQDMVEFDNKTWVVTVRDRSGPFTWALTVQASA